MGSVAVNKEFDLVFITELNNDIDKYPATEQLNITVDGRAPVAKDATATSSTFSRRSNTGEFSV